MIVDQEYWEKSYNSLSLESAPDCDPIVQFLARFVTKVGYRTCFEVGCYPGRFLSHLANAGFIVSGIDRTPLIKKKLVPWLSSRGARTGSFYEGDFQTFKTPERFDLVCSFGFIEHFENFKEMILRHRSLMSPGGMLIITTPNFEGPVQRFLHRTLDSTNYFRHNLSAMVPNLWRTYLESAGLHVEFCGYFGVFDFWIDNPDATPMQAWLAGKISQKAALIRRLFRADSRMLSPYCAIVAKCRQQF